VTRLEVVGTGIVRVGGGAAQVVKLTSRDGESLSGSRLSTVQLGPAVIRWSRMSFGRRTREYSPGRSARTLRTDRHAICTLCNAHTTPTNVLRMLPVQRTK